MKQKWFTADGKEVDLYSICYQHLSNIYYYTHFILAERYPEATRRLVSKALDIRFGGKALPYNPKFKWEIEYLKKQGWLKGNGSIIVPLPGIGTSKMVQIR